MPQNQTKPNHAIFLDDLVYQFIYLSLSICIYIYKYVYIYIGFVSEEFVGNFIFKRVVWSHLFAYSLKVTNIFYTYNSI